MKCSRMKSLRMRFLWSNFNAWANRSQNIPVQFSQLSFCMGQSSLEILRCFDFLYDACYLLNKRLSSDLSNILVSYLLY